MAGIFVLVVVGDFGQGSAVYGFMVKRGVFGQMPTVVAEKGLYFVSKFHSPSLFGLYSFS